LIPLAEKYPNEFTQFICSIKLVRTHTSVLGTAEIHSSKKRRNRDKWLIKTSTTKAAVDLWNEEILDEDVALFLPLTFLSNYIFLVIFVQICKEIDSVEIFDSPTGKTVLNYVWKTYGFKAHSLAFLKYMVFLTIFTFSIYSFDLVFVDKNADYVVVSWIMQIILLVVISIYVIQELLEINEHANCEVIINNKSIFINKIYFLLEHFQNLWNIVDLSIIVTSYIGVIVRFREKKDTQLSLCALSLASILTWFKILYFLRPFESSGQLGFLNTNVY
jgi:hypothetical protein